MLRATRPGVLLLLTLLAAARAQADPPPALALVPVVQGLDNPVFLTSPPGDSRLFVVEQRGRIRIISNGRLLPRPFLDLTDRVRDGGERGLLSVAFHPRYARNGLLFVNYTDRRGDTRIERYHVSRDPNLADKSSAFLLLGIDQPFANHNGGLVLFGPDGMLWIGMGDGGSAGDPFDNAQNLGSLLGKMLRIDVDHGERYAIPEDNPFVRRPGARPEVWAYGLRNPWRFCFDPSGRTLVIGDVGQSKWEEIDAAPAREGGLNYGWNWLEGSHAFRRSPEQSSGTTPPITEYAHDDGCSVIGGYVYRGRALPGLRGWYLYSDYCSSWLRGVRLVGGRAAEEHDWSMRVPGPVTSFGEDARGELYVLTSEGAVFRISPERSARR
jgi:glucose/arabinose dehydrogenase